MENKYIGKWYTSKVGGLKIIVYIASLEQAGEKYIVESYVGTQTVLSPNGYSHSMPYECGKNSFELMINTGVYKPFEF